jgi:hypothetical protein
LAEFFQLDIFQEIRPFGGKDDALKVDFRRAVALADGDDLVIAARGQAAAATARRGLSPAQDCDLPTCRC